MCLAPNSFVRGLALGALSLLGMCVLSVTCRSGPYGESNRPELAPAASVSSSPWTSADSCERALGRRAPADGVVRIATWNVRWFPDAVVEAEPKNGGTDLRWLGCALSWLDADVFVLQEIKTHPRARRAMSEIIQGLNVRSGGDWRVETMRCGGGNLPHIAFLYDGSRVQAKNFRDLPGLNPDPVCSIDVGPGFAGYFRFSGGLDLHIIGVHFLAGDEPHSLEKRRRSYAALPREVDRLQQSLPDSDVLIAGDWNTSGCEECKPPVKTNDELRMALEWLARPPVSFGAVTPSVPCTQGFSDEPQLLDHFVASRQLQQMQLGEQAVVSGHCAESRCAREQGDIASERLSDHCPVVLSLVDRDHD